MLWRTNSNFGDGICLMLYGLQNFHIQDSFGYYYPFSEMQSEVYKQWVLAQVTRADSGTASRKPRPAWFHVYGLMMEFLASAKDKSILRVTRKLSRTLRNLRLCNCLVCFHLQVLSRAVCAYPVCESIAPQCKTDQSRQMVTLHHRDLVFCW